MDYMMRDTMTTLLDLVAEKVNTTSYRELIKTLEDCWKAIQFINPEVPDAVIVVAGGGRGASGFYGHFQAESWVIDGVITHEVLIVAEQLNRGALEVFNTLLHESCHALAKARGVIDVGNTGRHNKQFKILCVEMLLIPPERSDVRHGWANTQLSEIAIQTYQKSIGELEKKLSLMKILETSVEKEKTSWKAECECKRKLRVSKKFKTEAEEYGDLGIVCTRCGSQFIIETEEEE